MTFHVETDCAYANAAQEDRCAPRHPIYIPARLRKSGDTAFNVVVSDISNAGFACRAVTSIKPGAICWLTLPGLVGMQAEVIWNDGSIVGCAFTDMLNPAVVDRLLALYPVPTTN